MDESTLSLGSRMSLKVRAATIHVAKGPDSGRQAKIDQVSFIVGVGETADLRLTDPAVSREHLRVTLGPSGLRVRDEGSKNGTYLGGTRVHDVTLTSDAALQIGGTTLALTIATDSIVLPLSVSDRFGDAIGTSTVMRHLFAQLERAAGSDLTILVEGESGVGKDLLARAIHAKSARKEGPMVIADCSAIPEHLIESELFGHERGAFTGADRARKGVVEEANGGTLFLDEIGELPLDLQPKLLRMMEQREIRPVGSNTPRPVDVRIIAATNRRLAEAARTGEFRNDLFYRLAVVRVAVPPLRERTEDILPIARAMLRASKKDPSAELEEGFASMLVAYSWPGNVRELRNVIERHAVLGSDEKGLFEEATALTGATSSGELANLTYHEARKLVLDRFDEEYLPRILERAEGVVARAAELAGVARPSFYRMLERIRPTKRTDGKP
ncbi:MAG: sigma 54-dependent Fis family transcriptional regulator [Labilithrix sp.]|nr:sigma 54-dependent Fis family transcriptional regulator [Labilithrix sp.]MBX3222973.1 sigma 54-dependent Fis family transcriptional regulator [Labilithrix sp.]